MPIRPPTPTESYRIAGLMDQSLRGVDVAYDALVRSAPRRWLARHLSLPFYFHTLNEGWVIEEEGEVRGWLYLLHRPRTTHVNELGVVPEVRRQGLGSRLLAWATQRAREQGKMALTLVVTATNEPARALYERAGFRAVHPWRWAGGTLPPTPRPSPHVRELEPHQRQAPFDAMWQCSLAADGHSIRVLLDVGQGPYGAAWELWEAGERVAYADKAERTLRLLVAHPRDEPLIGTALGALRPRLSRAPLWLDLGSDVADTAATPLLAGIGWQRRPSERLLMVKMLNAE